MKKVKTKKAYITINDIDYFHALCRKKGTKMAKLLREWGLNQSYFICRADTRIDCTEGLKLLSEEMGIDLLTPRMKDGFKLVIDKDDVRKLAISAHEHGITLTDALAKFGHRAQYLHVYAYTKSDATNLLKELATLGITTTPKGDELKTLKSTRDKSRKAYYDRVKGQ